MVENEEGGGIEAATAAAVQRCQGVYMGNKNAPKNIH